MSETLSFLLTTFEETATKLLLCLVALCLLLPKLSIMFLTLYSLLTSPWRVFKRTMNQSTNTDTTSSLKNEIVCILCGVKKARSFYCMNRCKHIFCFQCFQTLITKCCDCPTCSTVVHTFCKVCHGDKI